MPLTSKRQTKIAHDFASKSAWLMGADFLVQKIRIPDWCGAATKNETKIKGTALASGEVLGRAPG
jgi:hypothetical protein